MKRLPLRGEVWRIVYPLDERQAEEGEPAGSRHCLIMQHDILATAGLRAFVTVMCSSSPLCAGRRTCVPLAGASLPQPTWANVHTIATVNASRFRDHHGRVTPATMTAVEFALLKVFGIR
jgi:mRNA-degrading endonuclease toxin of MazEF toxin-antitoxin module